MCLAIAIRLDISFVMSKLNRFTSNLGSDHWYALEHVMRYLRGTSTYECRIIVGRGGCVGSLWPRSR